MILTCPSCTTRYLLSAQALAPDGRTVKCSNCAQEWFETPDPDELLKKLESDVGQEAALHDDIPDAIKPFNEYLDEEAKDGQYDKPAVKSKTGGQMTGYLAAAAVFVASFAALMAFSQPIYKAWPASASFYDMLGVSLSVPGEGLVFDRVKVNALNEHAILIEGAVINRTSEVQALPFIEATIRDKSGNVIDEAIIQAPFDTMDAESGLPFRSTYQGDVMEADHVQLRFLLSAPVEESTEVADSAETKTASEDDGNTPTPPADAHADPHGGEAH